MKIKILKLKDQVKIGGEQNVVEIGDFNNDKKPDVIFSVNA